MGQEKMTPGIVTKSRDVSLGIDISKHHLDASLPPQKIAQPFTNDRKGIAKLIVWIAPGQPTRIIFEATRAYHRALEMALGKAALPAVKINPPQAKRFAEATGTRVKTDPGDAAMLAHFGATLPPDIPPARDQIIDTLTELLVARRALVKDRTAALNRAKTLTLPLLKRHSQQHLQQIDAPIAAIDQEHKAIVATDAPLPARLDILLSIPGLGGVTVLALIGMPALGSMDARQATSLAGLAPVTRQSGNGRGKSFIQGGRATIRQAIYRPALAAIRFNADLKATYLALRAAGKSANVAIVVVMRTLIIITANALPRDRRRWTAQRQTVT